MEQRHLIFADVDAAKAEIVRLRAGYKKGKNWSLPQVCWHMDKIMNYAMRPGPHAHVEATPEMKDRLKLFLSGGKISGQVQAPESVTPPADAPETVVDDFLVTLDKFKN